MKKKILGVILIISGLIGFLLIFGSIGGMEVCLVDFTNNVYVALIGCVILVLVVFWGIPYYDSLMDLDGLDANGS